MMERKFLNINAILIGGLLLLSLGMLRYREYTKEVGGIATVQVQGTESTIEIPLNKNKIYNIESGKLPVTLQVENGAIRFINSQCPDHICENHGYISYENESATCMPAGVVVMVQKEQPKE